MHAIVVAGGAARRFGGRDKLRFEVDGRPVLARVLDALRAAEVERLVVVGPERPGIDGGCTVVREDPPGAGPVAALSAGLEGLAAASLRSDDVVATIAGDLAFLSAESVRALGAALDSDPSVECAVAIDASGRPQYLLAAWRSLALRRVLEALGDPAGRPVAALFDLADARPVCLPTGRSGQEPWRDIDELPGSQQGFAP